MSGVLGWGSPKLKQLRSSFEKLRAQGCWIFLFRFLGGLGSECQRLEGREPPLTLRQEKQCLYFGHLFPCTPGPFLCSTALFLKNSTEQALCYKKWACTTGWRLALYLCSPSPALGKKGGCVSCEKGLRSSPG